MEKSFEFDVFLSYSSRDETRVRRVAEALKRAGLRIFFGGDSVEPGRDIYLKIEEGLERSRIFLLFLSRAALESQWVNLERSTALYRDPTNQAGRFVPVLLEDCAIPEVIERFRRIDYRVETGEAWEALLAAVKGESPPSGGTVVDPRETKRRRRALRAAGGLLACFALLAAFFARGPTDIPVERPPVEVRGQVRHETGQPFAGAKVHLRDRETRSGADGNFKLTVPADWVGEDLSLQVSSPGFSTWQGKVIPDSNEIDIILERDGP
jgi:hypothetical protein